MAQNSYMPIDPNKPMSRNQAMRQQPQPAAGQPGGTPPNPNASATSPGGAAYGPGMANASDISRNNDVYNIANPQMALRSALRDMGYNPLSRNPVFRTLMSMAPGLAGSFLMQGANGMQGANTEAMMNQAGGMGGMFKNFLTSNLANNGTGAISTLRDPLQGRNEDGHQGAYGGLMTLERRLQEYEKSVGGPGGGADPSTLNPFSAYIVNMMNQDPGFAPSMISSQYTPFMGAFAEPYAQGVGMLNERARQEMSRDMDDPNSNPFAWMLNPGIR